MSVMLTTIVLGLAASVGVAVWQEVRSESISISPLQGALMMQPFPVSHCFADAIA